MNFTYRSTFIIENNKDYGKNIGIGSSVNMPILALHILRELKGSITIYNLQGITTTFPNTAFVPGGVYSYVVSRISFSNEEDHNSIVGCVQ